MTSKFPGSLGALVQINMATFACVRDVHLGKVWPLSQSFSCDWHFLLCDNLWKKTEVVVVETRYFCNRLILVCPIVHNGMLVLFPVTFSRCIRCSEQNVPELPHTFL